MKENKVWNAISGLTSGVLTSLIYDALSDTSYVLTEDEEVYVLVSQQENILLTICLTLLAFFSLWFAISILSPAVVRLFRQLSYKKIPPVIGKELVRTLDAAKASALDLYPIFFTDKPNQILMTLKVRELCRTAAALHRTFKPGSQKMQNNLPKHFRVPEHATIINMKHSVSDYELAAVVTLLERMAEQALAAANDSTQLAKDCNAVLVMLRELKTCFPWCFLYSL